MTQVPVPVRLSLFLCSLGTSHSSASAVVVGGGGGVEQLVAPEVVVFAGSGMMVMKTFPGLFSSRSLSSDLPAQLECYWLFDQSWTPACRYDNLG